MRNNTITIAIQNHADMEGFRACHVCGGIMHPSTTEHDVTTHEHITLHITGIKSYTCNTCGEIIYTSDEVKLIEDAVSPYLASKSQP